MRKLAVFNHVTLDGYFADADGGMSWAHQDPGDEEQNAFVAENAGGGDALLFGRITYQMMASWWPTPQALAAMPAVAEGMNRRPKVVFSRTLEEVSWSNTTLLKGDLVEEVRRMKEEPGGPMTILGSGTLVRQLSEAALIDEYQLLVNPVALGAGRTLFEGLRERLRLRLVRTRAFRNGNVLMGYERAR